MEALLCGEGSLIQSKFSTTLSTVATKHIGLSITRRARLSRLELTSLVSVVLTVTVNAAVVMILLLRKLFGLTRMILGLVDKPAVGRIINHYGALTEPRIVSESNRDCRRNLPLTV